MIRAGMLERCLAGGSEAVLVPSGFRAWELLRVMTPGLCRPFSDGRDGMILGVTEHSQPREGETVSTRVVRYRTVGDASCTGAVDSPARTAEEVVAEVATTRITERGATRADDRTSSAAMEDRKREGYF